MITYSSQLVQYSCSGCVGLHYLATYTDKKLKQIREETHGVAWDDTKNQCFANAISKMGKLAWKK